MHKEILFSNMESPRCIEEFKGGISDDDFDAFLADFNAAKKERKKALASRFHLMPKQRIFSYSMKFKIRIAKKGELEKMAKIRLRKMIRLNSGFDREFCKEWKSVKISAMRRLIECQR